MIDILGGSAAALRMSRGHAVKLVNTHGSQVVDTWCLAGDDCDEYLSVEQTRRMLFRLFPREADYLYSNRRTPMLLLEKDTCGCQHDMLFACCDPWVYQSYGCAPGHANCRDNFRQALAGCGLEAAPVPNPINFWMNVPVSDNSRLAIEPPASQPGDFIVLRALVDAVVIFSACPMDVTPVNGVDRTPKTVSFEILK